MNKKVLSFVNKLEGYKTAIKELHWDSDNMSQHELCDKIADSIAEFQDTVSEVEQSITGKLATGNLKPVSYKVTTLKKFVEDVLDATNSFYKSIENEGDSYTGMRSDCESFLSDMQRNLYLVGFTMKEDLKRRLAGKLNEGYKKEENIKTTFHGTKPSTEKGVLKRINDLTKNGQLNTRVFAGINEVLDFYRKILGNVGRLRCIDACAENNYLVKIETESGWKYYGLLRVKDVNEGQCKASITFSPHGDEPEVVEPNPEPMGQPVEDGRMYEVQMGESAIRMTGSEFHKMIKESVKDIIKEAKISKRDKIEFKGLNSLERLLKKIEFGRYDYDLRSSNLPFDKLFHKLFGKYMTMPGQSIQTLKEKVYERQQWLKNLSEEDWEVMKEASNFMEKIKDGYYDRTIAEDGEGFIAKANEMYPNHPEIESYVRFRLQGLQTRLANGENIRNVAGVRWVNHNAYTNPFHPNIKKEVRYEGDPEFDEFEPDNF